MPIGKNAIKRVENNGYSKVESSAPDMENSTVIANVDAQVVEKILAPVEKKTRAKKAVKPVETVKETPVAPVVTAAKPKRKPAAKKVPVKTEKDGFVRVEVGDGMPYYLL